MTMVDRPTRADKNPANGVLDADSKRDIRRLLKRRITQKRFTLEQRERFIDAADAAMMLWRLMPTFGALKAQRVRLKRFADSAEKLAKTLIALEQHDLSLLLYEHPRFREPGRDLAVVEQFSEWLDATISNAPTLALCARAAASAPVAEMHSKRGRKALLVRQIRRTWDFVLHPLPGQSKTSTFSQVLTILLGAVGERPASEGTLELTPESVFRIDDLITWTELARVASRSPNMAWAAKCLVLEPVWINLRNRSVA